MSTWRATRIDDRIAVAGDVRADDARVFWNALHRLGTAAKGRLDLDLAKLDAIDPMVIALLVQFRFEIEARGTSCEIVNATAPIAPFVRLYGGDKPARPRRSKPPEPGVISRLGMVAFRTSRRVHEGIVFIGELFESLGQIARRPRRANLRSLPALLERAGADAILIVAVLNFLLGLVIALQSTPQLKTFGANIYVADLVAISVTRELAPLMTAIIMCGRSGAAMTAELGTMHVSEEIDAMQTMGISPISHLVVPRILALAIVAPMLVLIGDVTGMLGGLVVGVVSLDLSAHGYISEVRSVLVPSDVWTGLIKGMVYGIAIALIGCQEGLVARGAAAGVGRRTTATVVAGLFVVVALDAGLTMLFRAVGV